MNWILGWISSFFRPQPTLDVVGTVTDLSGLVLPVSIGTPTQTVHVGLNFVTDDSLLYTGNACPPFLATACFVPEDSSSYSQTYEVRSPELWHGSAYERMVVGEVGKSSFVFNIDFESPYSSAWFRDAGGFLGAGPRSEIFKSKIIEISADQDGGEFRLREVVESQVPESVIPIPCIESATTWEFMASLGATGSLWFVFNPTEDGIILPETLKTRVLAYRADAIVDSQDVLWLDCSNRHIVLYIGGAPILLETPRNERGALKCATSIKFDSRFNAPMIGRILLRSVRGVFFDYRRAHILLELGRGSVGRFVASQESKVAIFNRPQVDHQSLVLSRTNARDGLVLMSVSPRTLFDGNVEYQCWTFHRLQRSWFPSVDVIGTGSEIAPSFSVDEVTFEMRNPENDLSQNALTITVFDGTVSTKICVSPNNDSNERPNLPPYEVLNRNLDMECAICLESMVEGQRVQGLNQCDHFFHSECIETWLRKARNKACPVCRRDAGEM